MPGPEAGKGGYYGERPTTPSMHRVTDANGVNTVHGRTTAPRRHRGANGAVLRWGEVNYNSQHAPRGDTGVTDSLIGMTTTPSTPLGPIDGTSLFPAQARSGLDAVRRRRRRRRRRWRLTRTTRKAAASSLTTARSEVLSPSPLLRPREPGDSGELLSPPALLLPSPSGGAAVWVMGGAAGEGGGVTLSVPVLFVLPSPP